MSKGITKAQKSFQAYALPYKQLYFADHKAGGLKHTICSTNPVGGHWD